MKILYIITKSNWGGAQRHVFDLALESKKKGYEAVVALGGNGILNERLMTEGIRTLSIGSMGRDIDLGNDAASFKDLSRIIHKERPDVLHLHSPKAAGLGSFLGRFWRVKKVIYTVHGWAFNENRPLHQKAAIAFFSWLTMIFSTHTILLSEKELGQAQKFPFVAQKLRLISLGITPPIFYGSSNARDIIEKIIRDKGLMDISIPFAKRPIVGTIAELHPNKGLVFAIEAIEKVKTRFPSIIYFIISDGEQKTYLEKLIEEKGLEKNVILAGYMENAAQYLKGFNIFLLPSVKEGLPYTIIEAGYASVPVIATTVGGIPEILDDMKSGILIQPKKAGEIAYAIDFFLRHKNIEKEYGKNLQDKVRVKYSLDKMAESIFKLYEETPPQKPSKTPAQA